MYNTGQLWGINEGAMSNSRDIGMFDLLVLRYDAFLNTGWLMLSEAL